MSTVRNVALGAVLAVALVGVAGCGSDDVDGDPRAGQTDQTGPAGTDTTAPTGEAAGGPCRYAVTPDSPPAKPVDPPPNPDPTPADGTVRVTFATDQGGIPLVLDRAKAPCTVQSFEHLAAAGFYDGVSCHRLVHADNFKVLQCGDPSGTGSGGPGYTIPDELPTDLQPAPNAPGASLYPRGSIAMANTGQQDSGGSQFFLVYGGTFLPPAYTMFGTIEAAGLDLLDTVGEQGHDGSLDPSPGGGKPKVEVTFTEVTVG